MAEAKKRISLEDKIKSLEAEIQVCQTKATNARTAEERGAFIADKIKLDTKLLALVKLQIKQKQAKDKVRNAEIAKARTHFLIALGAEMVSVAKAKPDKIEFIENFGKRHIESIKGRNDEDTKKKKDIAKSYLDTMLEELRKPKEQPKQEAPKPEQPRPQPNPGFQQNR